MECIASMKNERYPVTDNALMAGLENERIIYRYGFKICPKGMYGQK